MKYEKKLALIDLVSKIEKTTNVSIFKEIIFIEDKEFEISDYIQNHLNTEHIEYNGETLSISEFLN